MIIDIECPCCLDTDTIDESPKGYLYCLNCGAHINVFVVHDNPYHWFDDGRFHRKLETDKHCMVMVDI